MPRKRARLDSIRNNESIGAAIRELRQSNNITAGEINGISDRQVRRIERGHSVPRSATLEKLASAHGMILKDYLDSLASNISQAIRYR
jgi:transcriptional regulator with XRE-family HTH domain